MSTDCYPYTTDLFVLVDIPGTLAFYEEVHPCFQIPITLDKTLNQSLGKQAQPNGLVD